MHECRICAISMASGLSMLAAATPASAQAGAGAPAEETAPARTCAKDCHKDILDRKVMHGPAQSDCEACHVQGDPNEHKFYLPTKKEELCQRCHALPHQAVMHSPAKEGLCLRCHDPHGSSFPAMLVADPKKELCTQCHRQQFGAAKFVHGPVAVGACIVCHQPHSSAQPALLVRDARELCRTCHPEIDSSENGARHLHGALEQGCTACHSPHASDYRYQLHSQAPALCATCHKDKMDQFMSGPKVVHGALVEEGGCTVCHSPHASRLPSLQRQAQPAECLACHDRELKTPEGRTLTNMASLLALNPDHHGPIREGVCTACHNPHSADRFRLLVEDYPPQFYAPFSIDTFKLCFRCHIPDLVLKPNGRGLTRFRDGDKNLHWVHVNNEKGRTCRACHEVHASRRPAHIREAVPFGEAGWMLEINFLQTQRGGSCSPACHKTRSYDRADGEVPAAGSARTGAVP
jgi:predicted CXXCH cytochrome family protein